MVRISESSEISEKFTIHLKQKDRKSCSFIITLNTTNNAKQNGEIAREWVTTWSKQKQINCPNFLKQLFYVHLHLPPISRVVLFIIQVGSNMTGTDLCVNKPHCAAAVRPTRAGGRVEVVASLSQGRTAAAQCGLFTHKSVPVIFEPPCSIMILFCPSHIRLNSCSKYTYIIDNATL